MILGWFPEMLIGGVTYGIGRAYNKPWARVVGGGIMIVSTVWTVVSVGLIVGAVSHAKNQATGYTKPQVPSGFTEGVDWSWWGGPVVTK